VRQALNREDQRGAGKESAAESAANKSAGVSRHVLVPCAVQQGLKHDGRGRREGRHAEHELVEVKATGPAAR
jgi:hypothetical protein